MRWTIACFFLVVLCAPFAYSQSYFLNDQYFWCPPPSTNRAINLCDPANNQAGTGSIPLRAAIHDSHWPITVEILLNGRTVQGPNQPSSESIRTYVNLDPVSSAQTVTLRIADSQGSFEKSFTAYNQLSPPCTASSTDPSVALCLPANNATLTSPFQVKATATDSSPYYLSWTIYLDGHNIGGAQANGTDAHYVAIPLQSYTGKHRVTLQAHEYKGTATYQATANVNITAPAGCPPTLPGPGVHICSPGTTASGSQLHVVAKAYDTYEIKWMQVYIDRKEAYTARTNSIDTYLPITAGTHRLTVTETNWAGSGSTYSSTEYVSVQ